MGEHGVERFFSITCLGDNGDVAFNLKQRRERSQHHALIFRQHDTDGLAAFFRVIFYAFFGEGIHWLISLFTRGSFRGRVMTSVVPDLLLRSSVPPSIS